MANIATSTSTTTTLVYLRLDLSKEALHHRVHVGSDWVHSYTA